MNGLLKRGPALRRYLTSDYLPGLFSATLRLVRSRHDAVTWQRPLRPDNHGTTACLTLFS